MSATTSMNISGMAHAARVGGRLVNLAKPGAFTARVSPAEAADLLARNTGNRNISRAHVAGLVADILGGAWKVNGDAIRFSTEGDLLDGQHRLTACIQAGAPIETLIVTGLDPTARQTMDRGARRTIGQHLSMMGVPNANSVASTARELAGLALGIRNTVPLTVAETVAVAEANPDLMRRHSEVRAQRVITSSLLTAATYVIEEDGGPDAADAWLAAWVRGVPAYEGDPAHVLREQLIRAKGGTKSIRTNVLRALMASAINAAQRNEARRLIRVGPAVPIPGWSRARVGLPTVSDQAAE